MPARDPPKGHLFDIFPFSLLVHALTKKGKSVKGKKGARERAKRRIHNHNIPLEITLYLVRYVSPVIVFTPGI
jgi:putative membrane protein